MYFNLYIFNKGQITLFSMTFSLHCHRPYLSFSKYSNIC